MAFELVGGAALGAVFAQLQKEICGVKDNVAMFKPKLEELEETLVVLSPVIQEIEELNRRLNRPNHGSETIILRRLLEAGTKLVSRCSKIPSWDFLKQSRYREKLMELDNKILRFHNVYMQAHMGRDQKQTLLFMQETRQMLITSLNQQGFSNITMGITASSAGSSSNITMCDAPSSTGSFHKIAMRVQMYCQKCKARALKIVSAANGVNSVCLEGDDRNKWVVIGDKVDPAQLIARLWKNIGRAQIISVAQQQPDTIEDHTPNKEALLCAQNLG